MRGNGGSGVRRTRTDPEDLTLDQLGVTVGRTGHVARLCIIAWARLCPSFRPHRYANQRSSQSHAQMVIDTLLTHIVWNTASMPRRRPSEIV